MRVNYKHGAGLPDLLDLPFVSGRDAGREVGHGRIDCIWHDARSSLRSRFGQLRIDSGRDERAKP